MLVSESTVVGGHSSQRRFSDCRFESVCHFRPPLAALDRRTKFHALDNRLLCVLSRYAQQY